MGKRAQTNMSSRSFVIMCLLGFLSMLSSGMINPILPIYAKTLGAPYWLIGMTVSAFFVSRTFCEIPAGMLYQKIGWKIPVLFGMAIQAIATASAYFTDNAYALVAARILQGVGSTMFFLSALSLAAAVSPEGSHGKYVGTLQGVEWIGNVSGSALGGIVAESFGARSVFLTGALVQAFGVLVVARLGSARNGERIQETMNQRGRSISPWQTLLTMPAIYIASITIFFVMFRYQGVVNTILPIYVNFELGFDLVLLGVLAMCMSIGQMVAMFVGGLLADRVGYGKVLTVAILLSAISSPLYAGLRTLQQLIVLSFVFGATVGIGLTVSAALISSGVEPKQIGSAVAVYRIAMNVGGAVGPSVMTFLTEAHGYVSGFTISGGVMIIPLVLMARLRRSQNQ